MLLKVEADGSLKNMHVVYFPELTTFQPSITFPDGAGETGSIRVDFRPPPDSGKQPDSLEIPLQPDPAGLPQVEVVMHKSSTKAFDMGSPYSDWFSKCLGYSVRLVFLGDHRRQVLMSRSPAQTEPKSWLSTIASNIPLVGSEEKDTVTFQDCAAYLVVSQTSLHDVSARLPDGVEMDVTKFRPNIVIEGADEPWEEDYWGEIAIGDATVTLTHNCVRCSSINIDYETGKPGTGPTGQVLKKLQKDRRVDTGAKWSPVFGRYGFPGAGDEGKRISVGDEARILKRNKERTTFDWPGLGGS
ncbi:MOSC domain-containing protein [Macrophomina phaseolina]|nr:MOSC domain-containing protein [Macrophomina phaseolina]